MTDIQKETEQKDAAMHILVLRKTLELLTAGFALVAALAWNDAIQTLFTRIFGSEKTLPAKFMYALAVTAIVVAVGIRLSRLEKYLQKR